MTYQVSNASPTEGADTGRDGAETYCSIGIESDSNQEDAGNRTRSKSDAATGSSVAVRPGRPAWRRDASGDCRRYQRSDNRGDHCA